MPWWTILVPVDHFGALLDQFGAPVDHFGVLGGTFYLFGFIALSGCNYLFEYNYITLKLYQPRHVLPCRYKLFGYFAPNAAQIVHRVPCGHYFGQKATLII